MKKITILIVLLFNANLTLKVTAQNTTFNNVSIGTDVPAGGIMMKMNFPALTGGWARGLQITNETGAEKYIEFAAFGGSTAGVSAFKNAYIGKDWNKQYMTFLSNGNVGIGTTAPAQLLDVNGNGIFKGSVISSFSGDIGGRLIIENPSKMANGTAKSWNILNMTGNYGNSLQFWAYDNIGCGTGLCTNRFTLMDNGSVGIGTATPTANLEINAAPLESTIETLLKVRISDATQDYFRIANGTFTPGQFIPSLYGYHVSDNRTALCLNAAIESTNDNGTDPLMVFDSRLTGASIVNRPLFSWDSYGARKMTLNANGSLGIGTSSTGTHKLAVEGSIGAREIRVQATGWSDFVFDKKYSLPTLTEVEKHIKEKGHLKDIPSEAEVLKNGISLGEMDSKLLQKIEELTLYIIEMKKENEEMKRNISELKQQITTKK